MKRMENKPRAEFVVEACKILGDKSARLMLLAYEDSDGVRHYIRSGSRLGAAVLCEIVSDGLKEERANFTGDGRT